MSSAHAHAHAHACAPAPVHVHRFLGFFATQKCPKETQVAQACADKGGACQTEIEAAYGCGAKHVLALMAMEAEAQKQ